MNKITPSQWLDFYGRYCRTDAKTLRLGQAFCNTFDIADDNKLFYEVNWSDAYAYIFKNYVQEA
jgi:hypothetical protein